MMKKYSRADLLSDELYARSGEATFKWRFMHRLFKTKTERFHLKIPGVIYARSLSHCDDIEKLTEYDFDARDLMDMVVRDFVKELRKKNSGPLPPYQYIMDRYSKPLQVAHYGQIDGFNPTLMTPSSTLTSIYVEIRHDEALRLEWLLYDLEMAVPDHGLTVEKVLEILYCNYVEVVQKGGLDRAVDKIISFIEEE